MKINFKQNSLIGSHRNYILLGICGLLAIVNVIMTINSSATGVQISDLQKKESVLSDEKRTLQDELVKTLSVGQLQEKSLELGFAKPADVIYLSQSAPVAKLP